MKLPIIAAASILAISPLFGSMAFAENESSKEIRPKMDLVYGAFRELQPYLFHREDFLAEKNSKKIKELLTTMSANFHTIESFDSRFTKEPTFVSTLKTMNELLYDATNRFGEGKKEYVLWRMKGASTYCISCHTRFAVPNSFIDETASLKGLNTYEKANFLFATRQFDKAKSLLLDAAQDPSLQLDRMNALRKWIVIYTRVSPDPDGALTTLTKVREKIKLSPVDEQELADWITALRKWKSEKRNTAPTMASAEKLVTDGLAPHQLISGQKGAVELLRASAILHKLLDGEAKVLPNDRSHALYLLGVIYRELPLFFLDELPELILEQCIREFPGTTEAQRAFKLYREIVTLGYTGSGGTNIPDEVELTIKELHDLAYGSSNTGLDGEV